MEKPQKKQTPIVEIQPEVTAPRQIATLHGPTLIYVEGRLSVQDGDNQIPLVPFEEPPENRPGYLTLREAAKRYADFIDPANPAVQLLIARKTIPELISAAKLGHVDIVHRSRLLPVEQRTMHDDKYLEECRISVNEVIAYFVDHMKADKAILEQYLLDTDGATTISQSDGQRSVRPLPAQRWQENEILRVIGELGHDPRKLPKNKPGKAGVKAEVRALLSFSPKVFELAWERLRKDGAICNLE